MLGKGVRPAKDQLWGGDEAAFGKGALGAGCLQLPGRSAEGSARGTPIGYPPGICTMWTDGPLVARSARRAVSEHAQGDRDGRLPGSTRRALSLAGATLPPRAT